MPFAEKFDIGVINASPLHMGLLTESGAPDWHPAPTEIKNAVEDARAFCRERNADISDLALRLCFRYRRVSSTLVGMSDTDQVRRNLCSYRASTDGELISHVRALLEPVSNFVWSSGRSENND
jgi:L-galactose dehydrogenase